VLDRRPRRAAIRRAGISAAQWDTAIAVVGGGGFGLPAQELVPDSLKLGQDRNSGASHRGWWALRDGSRRLVTRCLALERDPGDIWVVLETLHGLLVEVLVGAGLDQQRQSEG